MGQEGQAVYTMASHTQQQRLQSYTCFLAGYVSSVLVCAVVRGCNTGWFAAVLWF